MNRVPTSASKANNTNYTYDAQLFFFKRPPVTLQAHNHRTSYSDTRKTINATCFYARKSKKKKSSLLQYYCTVYTHTVFVHGSSQSHSYTSIFDPLNVKMVYKLSKSNIDQYYNFWIVYGTLDSWDPLLFDPLNGRCPKIIERSTRASLLVYSYGMVWLVIILLSYQFGVREPHRYNWPPRISRVVLGKNC